MVAIKDEGQYIKFVMAWNKLAAENYCLVAIHVNQWFYISSEWILLVIFVIA